MKTLAKTQATPISSYAAAIIGALTGVLVGLALVSLAGCSIPFMGGGKLSIGYSSTTEVYMEHTVDGDKEGVEARAGLEINQSVLEALIGSDEPDPE